jgi:hypothetical protein
MSYISTDLMIEIRNDLDPKWEITAVYKYEHSAVINISDGAHLMAIHVYDLAPQRDEFDVLAPANQKADHTHRFVCLGCKNP